MDYRLFVASKSFIRNTKGEILILKESSSYEDGTNFAKYDVPGGRIKPGEKLEESLKREVYEETGLEVQVLQSFFVGEWRPKVKDENWQVIGIYFVCESFNENIVLSKDHDDYVWIRPEDYKNHNIIDNLANAFEEYLKL